MNSVRRVLIVAVAVAAAAGATPEVQSIPEPLRSDYRLKVVEPVEGSSVAGDAVRVSVDLELRPSEGVAAKSATPPPRPQVDVFLDKEAKGTFREGQNSLVIPGVPAGTHTLLVTASDKSGAVLERKEVHFTVRPPSLD